MMQTLRHPPLDAAVLSEAADLIRVLGHPVRLRLIECLEGGERCVKDLQQAIGAPQAIVSQQLARMRAAGIVKCRRAGANVWYRAGDPRVLRVLDCLRHCETPPRSGSRR
jgi:DNA-binding transcriptional ArsR family regulator